MIKFLKLITGEDIVSEVEEHDTTFFLKTPAVVKKIMVEDASIGQQVPRSIVEPFTPHVKGHNVHINKNKVLFIGEPIPTLADYYTSVFGSGETTSTPIVEAVSEEE